MDVLATYGPWSSGRSSAGCSRSRSSPIWVLGLADLDYEMPPWESVALGTLFAAPIVAFVGTAALVGPSSDLANFLRAVGGVLIGLATFFGLQLYGLPRWPQEFKVILSDGRTLTGSEARAFDANRGVPFREAGSFNVPWLAAICRPMDRVRLHPATRGRCGRRGAGRRLALSGPW